MNEGRPGGRSAPIRPGRGDYTETMETLIWHERLKGRVADPDDVPEYRIVVNGITSTRASRSRTPTSSPSMAACATNA